MTQINKVCVVGSGVMGSGIAAQIANSRTDVVLLDIAGSEPKDYNSVVKSAFTKIQTQKPAPLSHPDLASYITIGNLKEDLALIKDCDLVIEVIIEQLAAKHNLYKKIAPFLKDNAIITSNTSTLPLAKLKENIPKAISKRLVITHFFNPPRYMELVELVTDRDMGDAKVKILSEFLTHKLGKTIVHCNDTPGFIANRVGCFLLELAVRRGINYGLNPAKIDHIFSKLFGFPSTGVYGLYDLIGHDVMALISKSLMGSLPGTDRYHQVYLPCLVLHQMGERGVLGRKTGAGFYRLTKKGEVKTIEQIDFTTLGYKSLPEEKIPDSIVTLLAGGDKYSNYFFKILREFFTYVISLVPSVTNNPGDIDKAMKLGYSLKVGPFELLTTKLPDGQTLMEYLDLQVYLEPGSIANIALQDTNPLAGARLIKENDSAQIFDYYNGLVLVINSKMNCLNHKVFEMIIEACQVAEDKKQRLYIYPAGQYFSAGADIKYLKDRIKAKKFGEIEQYIELGQRAMMALKHSKYEVISCAKGIALGGGCEILLHSDIIIANQNLNAGLVELGVGLIPGWGGVKEMFLQSRGNTDKLVLLLRNILEQNKSGSADYFLRDYHCEGKINMHKDYLLTEALGLPNSKISPISSVKIRKFDLASRIDTSHYDSLQMEVIDFLQKIINMEDLTEEKILEFEKEKFLELCARPLCLKRLGKFV